MNSTLCALSSVARLSVSMTMLMSSGAHRKRLYVDALTASASSSGVCASRASSGKHPAAAGDDDPTSSGPTPPQAHLNRVPHHRHLWKANPKRTRATSATSGRGLAQAPVRIESLPDMWNDMLATPPESAASFRRKVYGTGGRRRPQASSLSGVRGHHRNTGACASVSNDAVTTEESSTSCGEDSSDGQVFDIIREESIKRPSGQTVVQKDTNTDDKPTTTTSSAAGAIQSVTSRSSPVNNSGVSIVIDNNELPTETDTLATESSSSPVLNASASSPGIQQQQQHVDERTSVCQQSGSKTFLLSEMT